MDELKTQLITTLSSEGLKVESIRIQYGVDFIELPIKSIVKIVNELQQVIDNLKYILTKETILDDVEVAIRAIRDIKDDIQESVEKTLPKESSSYDMWSNVPGQIFLVSGLNSLTGEIKPEPITSVMYACKEIHKKEMPSLFSTAKSDFINVEILEQETLLNQCNAFVSCNGCGGLNKEAVQFIIGKKKMMQAIKSYRDVSGLDFKEAKDSVENWMKEFHSLTGKHI